MCNLQVAELGIQDFKHVVPVHVFVYLVSYLQNRPFTAVAKTVIAFQEDILFQAMVFQIFLYHLKCLLITAAETGTAHANLDLFSNQYHGGIASKLIKSGHAGFNL